MSILVINSWSSSIKYELFDMIQKKSLANWLVEEIWSQSSQLIHKIDTKKTQINKYYADHKQALQAVFEILTKWNNAILSDINDISAIWHRVVHGWEEFSQPTIINDKVIKQIESCIPLAPLHNPANLQWINTCKELMPNTPQVAVFDTAFYQSMNIENFLYPIPFEYYKKDKVRKSWFHGTSHDYVSHKACKNLWKKYNTQNIITCHIGNGASITAIKKWKVFKTSMGMTPLDWVMMWTRSWSIDPSIVWYLHKQEHLSISNVEEILNKKSWLLWVSQKSSDMRDIIKWINQWNKNCQIAYNMYINRIIKYIGAYMTLMWWVDIIVFTAWVLENQPTIRKDIMKRLKFMWIQIDTKNNKVMWEMKILSTPESKIAVMLVPTDEEYMIAKYSHKLINN